MPEGPEVKRITERMNGYLAGEILTNISFLDLHYRSKQVRDEVNEFMNTMPHTIDSVRCKGKFIYWTLDGGKWHIWQTLGMSGTWRKGKKPPHARLTLHTTKGDFHYKDSRKFGTFKFFEDKPDLLMKKLEKDLGPDMLNENVGDGTFITQLRKKDHHNICKVIMNQKVICGVGNYIKSEALYKARIHPWKTVGMLTDTQLQLLNQKIKEVIYSAYQSKGATFSDYQLPDGSIGTYTFKFEVYNKRRDPHGHNVIKEVTPDKRMTHWIKEVQV